MFAPSIGQFGDPGSTFGDGVASTFGDGPPIGAIPPDLTFPQVSVLVSFNAGPLVDPVAQWTDISHRVESFSTERGRSSELDDYQTGTCQLVVDNTDRDFDVYNPAS